MIEIQPPFTSLYIGSTMSGKTYLCKKILKEQLKNKFDYTIVMSPTAHLSQDWGEFKENHDIKKGKVFQVVNDNFKTVTEEIISSQKDLFKSTPVKERDDIPNILLIFDDLIGEKLLRMRGILDMFSSKNRHYKISMMVLIQKLTGIPTIMRTNSKYIFLFNQSNYKELESFLETYTGKKYRKLLRDNIEDIYNEKYNFILVDNFNPVSKNKLLLNGKSHIIEKLMK